MSSIHPNKGLSRRCPYATLNLYGLDGPDSSPQRQVSDDEIRDAYKRLSRLLHPDKRPPGRERDDAQEMYAELMNAYEILSDPVLRQAYDHYGHRAVIRIRHNLYDSDSLYRALSNLHRQGKAAEALETLTSVLEGMFREKRNEEWQFQSDVQVNLHVNPAGSNELIDVSGTSVSFSSTVPMVQPGSAASHQNSDHEGRMSAAQNQQQMQLSIGAHSYLEKGMGATLGMFNVSYKPSEQTFVSSELKLGRNHLETSLSSIQKMINRTVLSATVSHKQEFGSDKIGRLSFAFTSSRPLSLIRRRNLYGKFALNLGCVPPADFTIKYGHLSFTTWGLWAESDDAKDNEVDESRGDDESDAKSHNSGNASTKSTGNEQMEAKKSNSDHPPKITAMLALGQFPLKVAIEQDHLFDSPDRSIEASISYNPYRGLFSFKGMLTRDLSDTTSLSIGMSHVGLSGLTWLFQYDRQELSLTIPIFVAAFMAPNYWNIMLFLSTLSYLIDETLGEFLGHESSEKVDTPNIHERIVAEEQCVIKEQEWMHSSHAKVNSSQQIQIMKHIAKAKMDYEESVDGLVILSATYEWLSNHPSKGRTFIDVATALQFWVQDSKLILPAYSKRMLFGFYDLYPRAQEKYKKDSGMYHTMIDCVNELLAYLGFGQTSHQNDDCKTKTVGYDGDISSMLTIRYIFDGVVYEIVVDDEQSVSLPCLNAFVLGSGKVLL